MSTSTDTTLTLRRTIDAAPPAVFAAWTEPAQLKEWSCPEGMTVADAQVDLRVGGRYLLDMVSPDGKHHTAHGEYREIDAPRKLVYTWDWKQDDHRVGETLVTVEFRADGERTEVVMVHTLLPSIESRDSHREGWTSCLDRLEKKFA